MSFVPYVQQSAGGAIPSSPWPPAPGFSTVTAHDGSMSAISSSSVSRDVSGQASGLSTSALGRTGSTESASALNSSAIVGAPGLPPVVSLKRPNPKRLSLSLAVPSPASSSPASSSSGGSTVTEEPYTPSVTTPFDSTATPSSFSTPFTPGPPKTPHLAISVPSSHSRASIPEGAASKPGLRRPSQLSLITQPPTGGDEVPPTPGGLPRAPLFQARQRPQLRTMTQVEEPSMPAALNAFGSKSAFPSFAPILESHPPKSATYMPLDSLITALPSSGGSVSTAVSGGASGQTSSGRRYLSSSPSPPLSLSLSLSPVASSSTTPASSPPLEPSYVESAASLVAEPYADGPIEILPGFYLGAEDSYLHPTWQGAGRTVRVLNVAQEIDNPFLPAPEAAEPGWSGSSSKGKERQKVLLSQHEAGGRTWEYCQLRWSHGETGLADLPPSAKLDELVRPSAAGPRDKGKQRDEWGFWEAITWVDEGRRMGIPTLVHCQCGVSRSATMAIAYVMAIAAAGTYPEHLGGLSTMQQVYDYVKKRSSSIGPNVSLVFQLVEFARNLSSLLSASPAYRLGQIKTSWPSTGKQETEDEWARRRRAFDEVHGNPEERDGAHHAQEDVLMSPAEEAREWDKAMVARHQARVHA